MIYSGLECAQFFEIDPSSIDCHNILFAITPACRMLFTFIQMYFIFLNSKVTTLFCIHTTRKPQHVPSIIMHCSTRYRWLFVKTVLLHISVSCIRYIKLTKIEN